MPKNRNVAPLILSETPFGRRLVGLVMAVAITLAVADVLYARKAVRRVSLPARLATVPEHPATVPPRPAACCPPVRTPDVWRTGDDYVLRVQKRKVLLPGAPANGGPREVELITYNGGLVGPTIRVQRGSRLKIRLINELPTDQSPALEVDPQQEEPPHDLYTTNLHTHGLHVSPSGNSDNVFREVPPGASAQYEFDIPADHPSGTFWYHPHKHGSVAYQMANGLSGALIVEGDDGGAPVRDLEQVPEIAAAQEQIMVLQHLVLRTDEHGVGRVDPNDVYNEPDPRAYQVMTVNGAVMPTYHIRPEEVQRWRIIHAGRLGSMVVCWYDGRKMPLYRLIWHEIAIDGLATGTITARRSVTLRPGNRSDVLFRAPSTRGTYYLTALEEDETTGREILTARFLARVVVDGPARPMKLPNRGQLAACRPFAPIEASECTVKRELVFDYDEKAKVFHINGTSFSNSTGADRHELGTAEEWTLTAANTSAASNEPHPFHIHVNPFQVVQVEKLGTAVVTKRGDWHDTMVVEKGRRVTIRMRFRDFAGKTVLHCHTLDHEDQGMMRAIQIVDPTRANDGGATAGRLQTCAFPAPTLETCKLDGMPWNLRSVGRRPTVVVFILGLECSHCKLELRRLLNEARTLVGTDTAFVAVSSRPIRNLAQALAALDAPKGLDFQFVTDEADAGFRSFGCYTDQPLHGLFVIDRTGVVRAKYTGDVPFADPQAVVGFVRQLRDSNGTPAP